MKKLLLLLLFLAATTMQAQSEFNFKGTIKNPTVDSLVINGLSHIYHLRIPVDKNGNFEVKTTFDSYSYELQYGFSKQYVYLNEKTNLTLTADGNDFSGTLMYTGEGAAENNFLQSINTERQALVARLTSGEEKDIKKLKKIAEKAVKSWYAKLGKQHFPKPQEMPMSVSIAMQQQRTDAQVNRLQFLETLGGTPAPQFSYKDVNGTVVNLSDFKGKYVLIDVWATWCHPCIAENPHLKVIEEEFKTKNIVFIGLSLDKPQQEAKWKKFVTEKALPGVQLIADNEKNSEFIKACGVAFIPRFILINPDGTIADAYANRPSDGLHKQLCDVFGKKVSK